MACASQPAALPMVAMAWPAPGIISPQKASAPKPEVDVGRREAPGPPDLQDPFHEGVA